MDNVNLSFVRGKFLEGATDFRNTFDNFLKSDNKLPNGEPVNEDTVLGGSWFSNEESCLALSRKQRILGFMCCLVGASVCFTLAFLFLPTLVLKPRKFVLLFSLGGLLVLTSFAILRGPMTFLKNALSSERMFFTAAYFITTFSTLYCALGLRSTILTLACAIAQLFTLLWYFLSYIPGGSAGFKVFVKIFLTSLTRKVGNVLPV
eukprot:Colp12_sorted_trinity150504_noHs@18641